MDLKITFSTIKNALYKEGFHILVCSDSQVKQLSGFSKKYCRDKNSIKGLVLPDKNEIVINKSLSVKERVLTLIHELIHLANPKLSEKQTEHQTQALYRRLTKNNLGYLEFAVSHDS